MMKTKTAVVALAAFTAVSCAQFQETTGLGEKASTGAAVGAAAGGILGAVLGDSGWAIGGAILGGLAGAYIGDRMDQQDKQMAGEASERAITAGDAGEQAEWENAESGNQGMVVINQVYNDSQGRLCKDFTETVTLEDGTISKIDGTACQNATGQWEMIRT